MTRRRNQLTKGDALSAANVVADVHASVKAGEMLATVAEISVPKALIGEVLLSDVDRCGTLDTTMNLAGYRLRPVVHRAINIVAVRFVFVAHRPTFS
jgi:hypothetical protein